MKNSHSKIESKKAKSQNDLLQADQELKQKRFCDFVERVVCSYYGIKIESLHEKNRSRGICKTRQVCIYFCQALGKLSPTYMAKYYGMTHATMIHAVKTTKNQMVWDKDLKREITQINETINFESRIKNKALNFVEDFYYVDLDNFNSIQMDGKTIILVGYNGHEIYEFLSKNDIKVEPKEHFNTKMYILEDKRQSE